MLEGMEIIHLGVSEGDVFIRYTHTCVPSSQICMVEARKPPLSVPLSE